MHPPADVEPARVRITEQSGSATAACRMRAARAASREVKDIFSQLSISSRPSNSVMSI